ncbi:MAG: hypothetical protein ACQKBY_06450 [Verrucomicrobiales bacterium]
MMRFLVLMMFWAGAIGAQADLVRVLPLTPGDGASTSFEVKVNGKPLPVAYGSFHGGMRLHHGAFEMDGEVEIEVKALVKEPKSFRVRPSRHGIQPEVKDHSIRFRITEPLKLVVEAEGIRPLFLFALPREEEVPAADAPKLHFFGPGEHEVGELRVKSGETVYLAAGARVKGRLYALEAEGVTVRGRGVWDARGFTSKEKKLHGMLFERCRDVRIEGIQLRTGPWWQCHLHLTDKVRIDHFHTMSFGLNNDGVDIDGVTDLEVRNSFIGCGDDGFGWHGIDAVANGEPATRDCLAERCVIWNEHAGNGLRLGASLESKVFENIVFRDIDVLHVRSGGVAIMSDLSDWAHVRNVLFERFYNESEEALMDLSNKKNRYTNDTGYRDERGLISDLYFKEVTSINPGVILKGADAEHPIRDLYFVDCELGGKKLSSAEGFVMNEFVAGLHFPQELPEWKEFPEEKIATRSPAELVLDAGEEGAWAFAGAGGLSEVALTGSVGGQALRLASLGWGHAAVYEPRLAGRYEVFVNHVKGDSFSTKSPWTVRSVGGYDTTILGAEAEAGWHSLGVFELDGRSWVRLVDPHYQVSDGPVAADAVRFVKRP